MKIVCNRSNPPLGGLLTAAYIKALHSNTAVDIQWGEESVVHNDKQSVICDSNNDVLRAIARLFDEGALYGRNALEKSEVDSWLTYSIGPLSAKSDFDAAVQRLGKILAPSTYLVGKRFTIADFAVFSVLYVNKQWQILITKKEVPVHLQRWYNYILSQEYIQCALSSLPDEAKTVLNPPPSTRQSLEKSQTGSRQQEGKFVELPGAEMGKVVVRFPPEASGYLHIGHAKAALLNQYYQQTFQGKLIMRFDDTNPAKENVHFEKVILEDVAMLEIKPDMFTHTSEYFDQMIEYCEKLLKEEKAYVDDTEPEQMKQEREQRIESRNRNNTCEKNLSLWKQMKEGTEIGQRCCVRVKIDMQSPNGCMRDPTIYRCKNEPHPRTGTKYKVYPTYDFACPIVDAIEGVTHTLRTMEYHDRDAQFYWFIEALGLRRPYIWEYSRLSMTNTVLSKRKLAWFVEEGLVDGWDDPRFPTVRGVLRRGMTVEGLKQFIIAQGSSRSVVFMEWDKIWSFNKKVIDPIAPRYTAIDFTSYTSVHVEGVKEEKLIVPKHPKNAEVGEKELWIGPKILIDTVDAETLKEGENATFINWGNLLIKKINRENGKITSISAQPNIENKDYKKTIKLTWLAETEKAEFTPTYCVYFDHIISKALLGKDEDFKQYIGHQTRVEYQMLGDPELRKLKKGDIIQLQRRGYFIVDVPYEPINLNTCREQPVILFNIPDGHKNDNPMATPQVKPINEKEASPTKAVTTAESRTTNQINSEIIKQGDIVRNLKAQKAEKSEIDGAVKLLLSLKAEYKAATNSEWKPGCVPAEGVESSKVSSAKASTTGSKTPSDINTEIIKQGDVVRNLKAQKADKNEVDGAVKVLLSLKSEYKTATNTEWKPGCVPPDSVQTLKISPEIPSAKTATELNEEIIKQGDIVRNLKSKKAEKTDIDNAVKVLLALKSDYKAATNTEWKPGCVPPASTTSIPIVESKPASTESTQPSSTVENNLSESAILQKITEQGNKVRDLKSKKADKATVDAEVKVLLSLKTDYKNLTGKDWKPGAVATPIQETEAALNNSTMSSNEIDELVSRVNDQGNIVRNLKANKAPKEDIDAAIRLLLDLKGEYKNLTGRDFPVTGRTITKQPKEVKQKQAKESAAKSGNVTKEIKLVDAVEESGTKKQTRLGLEAKKEENLADWYSQVITKGELIEYYDVSGCYILRPWSYAIWEAIKDWFDSEIKKLGVQNCYFPIFVSRAALEKEKSHIADFSPEVAWVTKSGDSDMAEPIAIRPTSETVMYPAYAKWIQSYRDLPIKLNQWNNVVRWEFKHPQPFLRTREFLWQEGHTAYAIEEDAKAEVPQILDLYAKIYTDLLAIPVIKGRKTEKEKFAGGNYTYTVEAFVSVSGRAIQGATSHHLGQNFSKIFDIVYEDPETKEKKYIYQNSWGITTRTIGVMIMVHADNQGLILPPKVATIQVVIVPCGVSINLSDADRTKLQNSCSELEKELLDAGIKVKGDYRDNYSPGWKFNHWELKGVPIRVELGPKDIKNQQLVAVRRDTGDKITIKKANAIVELKKLLDDIHNNLYAKASNDLASHTIMTTDWSQFSPNLDKKCIILAPFCGSIPCEDNIKKDSTRENAEDPNAPSMGAKSLCIPNDQPLPIKNTDKCIHPACKNKPLNYVLFGRSY
ncbi:hypothetical protein Trydic_g22173 [Trypoxylus dichotomus]